MRQFKRFKEFLEIARSFIYFQRISKLHFFIINKIINGISKYFKRLVGFVPPLHGFIRSSYFKRLTKFQGILKGYKNIRKDFKNFRRILRISKGFERLQGFFRILERPI